MGIGLNPVFQTAVANTGHSSTQTLLDTPRVHLIIGDVTKIEALALLDLGTQTNFITNISYLKP